MRERHVCGAIIEPSDYETGFHWPCGFPLDDGPFLLAQDITEDHRFSDVPYDIAHVYCWKCYLPVDHIDGLRWRCPRGHTEFHPWMKKEKRYA